MKLVYLHGHGASADSFNFIDAALARSRGDIFMEYDSKNGFSENLGDMIEHLRGDFKVFFIAHSLGGLYALHLAGEMGPRVAGAVTMGTPYGGSESALALNFISPQRIYRDIHPTAWPITRGRQINLHGKPWTAIVSTKGHSQLMTAANDGVVTDISMRDRRGATFADVASNHHEIIQSRHSLAIIQAAIDNAQAAA